MKSLTNQVLTVTSEAMKPEDKRKIDDPLLNQNASSYDKDESFEDSDDFLKYDDTSSSNLDPQDPIVKSDAATNDNAKNETPTFTRTYTKNESDKTSDDAGKFDGNIGI